MRDPDRSLGFLINDVARLLRREFTRRAQDLGLSLAQAQALAYLSRQEGVNQATLADSLDIQPITLVRLIDRLQEMGVVDRRPDPGDRRALRLFLTPAAGPYLDRIWALGAETRTAAMAGMPAEEVAALIEGLADVKRNLLDADRRVETPDARKNTDDA